MGRGAAGDKRPPSNATHPAHVVHYKSIAGWQSMVVWRNPEHGGFWEPWDTGGGPYALEAEAIAEAKAWAEAWSLVYWGKRK